MTRDEACALAKEFCDEVDAAIIERAGREPRLKPDELARDVCPDRYDALYVRPNIDWLIDDGRLRLDEDGFVVPAPADRPFFFSIVDTDNIFRRDLIAGVILASSEDHAEQRLADMFEKNGIRMPFYRFAEVAAEKADPAAGSSSA